MAVGGVDDECVDSGGHECLGTLHAVGGDADACGHAQAAKGVLAGVGLVLGLLYILICDEADELAVGVDDGELLDLVPLQDLGGLLQVGGLVGDDEVPAGHDLVDRTGDVFLEAEVAVGDDAAQDSGLVDDGDSPDMVFLHELQGLAYAGAGADGDGVVDHAVLGTLDGVDLAGLLCHGHVLVDDSDSSLAGDGDCERGLGDGVHGSRHEGHIELDVAGKARGEAGLAGQYGGKGGNEKDVVECQPLHFYSIGNERHLQYFLPTKLLLISEICKCRHETGLREALRAPFRCRRVRSRRMRGPRGAWGGRPA